MREEGRIQVHHEDGVAHLVLDYAPVNQFSEPFVRLTLETVEALPDDTRAVVLSSAVDGIFAAGGDIPWMARAPLADALPFVALCQAAYSAFELLPCPAIAAIEGACLGGGLELALACDIRVVAEGALLGLPEVTVGIIAGAGGTQRLPRAIGQARARELLLTGRRFSGVEAGTLGLANHVVAGGEAVATALGIARSLADGATEAIQATKRLALTATDQPIAAGLDRERAAWAAVRQSATAQEGLDAFAAKRRPDFRAVAERERQPPRR
ncbi:MAG: enoyl-CoA hydratase/isomerase family protein [Conexibacter sp.]|nr:enoyl-CoA hydratase/isomerase family protein [Conexibacter sp.]